MTWAIDYFGKILSPWLFYLSGFGTGKTEKVDTAAMFWLPLSNFLRGQT